MRPSCITEKMMKTIGKCGGAKSNHQFQPSPTNERRSAPKNHSAPAHPGPQIPQPRPALLRSFTARRLKHPSQISPNHTYGRLWAPSSVSRSPSGGSLLAMSAGVKEGLRTSLYAKKIMKKIVARWKIPLSGLLIYIGAAYTRPRSGASASELHKLRK